MNLKYLASLVLAVAVPAFAQSTDLNLSSGSVTHRIPAVDTTNIWSGLNQFTGPVQLPANTTVNGSGICTASSSLNCPPSNINNLAGTPSALTYPAQFNSNGTNLFSDNSINMVPGTLTSDRVAHLQAPMTSFAGPKVDITNTQFAGGADRSGVKDSTAAILAAIAFAQSKATSTVGAPVVYLPAGEYKISSTLYVTGAAVSFEGDGNGSTIIYPQQTTGAVIQYQAAGVVGVGHVHVSGIEIYGIGHLSGATLLEIDNTQNVDVYHNTFANGASCFIAQGAAERLNITENEFFNCRRPIVNSGNANENYYTRNHIFIPGQDDGASSGGIPWSYSVNAQQAVVNGITESFIPSTGTMYPDYHAAITVFSGQNVHVLSGSIKSTVEMACIQFLNTNGFSAKQQYCEAAAQPSLNPDVQAGGAAPLGHTLNALPAAAATVNVDDGIYFPFQYATVNDLTVADQDGDGYGLFMFAPDFKKGGTQVSKICASNGVTGGPAIAGCTILTGTYEFEILRGGYAVQPSGSSTFGLTRPTSGALSWPAGAVVGIGHNGDDADGVIQEMHLNGLQGVTSGQTAACSATTLNGNWKFTPAEVCSTTIVGPVVDGYLQQTKSNGNSIAGGANADPQGNLMMIGNVEYGVGVDGQAQTTIPSNGVLVQNEYGCTPNSSGVASNLFGYYNSGPNCQVTFPAQSDGSAPEVRYRDVSGNGYVDTVGQSFVEQFATLFDAGFLFSSNFDIRDYTGANQLRVRGVPDAYPGIEYDESGVQAWQLLNTGNGTVAEQLTGSITASGNILSTKGYIGGYSLNSGAGGTYSNSVPVATLTRNQSQVGLNQLGSGTPASGSYVDGGTGAWTPLPTAQNSALVFHAYGAGCTTTAQQYATCPTTLTWSSPLPNTPTAIVCTGGSNVGFTTGTPLPVPSLYVSSYGSTQVVVVTQTLVATAEGFEHIACIATP